SGNQTWLPEALQQQNGVHSQRSQPPSAHSRRASAAHSPTVSSGAPQSPLQTRAPSRVAGGRRRWTREELVDGVRAGDRRALARAITLAESSDPLAVEVVRELYPCTGRAYTVGVTGPPGVGKSSLVAALLPELRRRGLSVGVVSVDPSSPF